MALMIAKNRGQRKRIEWQPGSLAAALDQGQAAGAIADAANIDAGGLCQA